MTDDSDMNKHKPAREFRLWEVHPSWTLISIVAGAVGLLVSLVRGYPPRELGISLLCGLCMGLPIVLFEKWLLRRYKDSQVACAILPPAERHYQWTRLWSLPLAVVFLYGMQFMRYNLHVPRLPGASLVFILLILAYPEQKAIYQAAKARLREADGS